MKPLYTSDHFLNAKSRELLPFECEKCSKTFYGVKNEIQKFLARQVTGTRPPSSFKFCSKTCNSNGQLYKCKQCNSDVYRTPSDFRKNLKNIFCNSSCASKYNNTHKTKGTRKSKLESWLEVKLPTLYPKLEFQFNRKDAINSELDIYIPSLKLAFELNGIFHYEPIYGTGKLGQIKNNDDRKFQACIENGIELCIIDTSIQKKFSEKTSKIFLDIINNIINQKIQFNGGSGVKETF